MTLHLWVPLHSDPAASPPPSVDDGDKANAGPSRISAEIVNIGKVPFPKLRETIRRDAAKLFWLAFDGDSLHAKCVDAARKVRGVSADTFARLYDEETEKVESALITAMLYWYQVKHDALPPLPGLIARAMIGGDA